MHSYLYEQPQLTSAGPGVLQQEEHEEIALLPPHIQKTKATMLPFTYGSPTRSLYPYLPDFEHLHRIPPLEMNTARAFPDINPPPFPFGFLPNYPSDTSNVNKPDRCSSLDVSSGTETTNVNTVAPSDTYQPPGPSTHIETSEHAPKLRYQKRHMCKVCGKPFDRSSRARDHEYKDRDEKPYHCRGQCGSRYCTMSYCSEERLLKHINPNVAQCPDCPAIIARNNIARHRKNACPNRFTAGPSGSDSHAS